MIWLRHSCASLLLAMGIPARLAMETLGHSIVDLTLPAVAGSISALPAATVLQAEIPALKEHLSKIAREFDEARHFDSPAAAGWMELVNAEAPKVKAKRRKAVI